MIDKSRERSGGEGIKGACFFRCMCEKKGEWFIAILPFGKNDSKMAIRAII